MLWAIYIILIICGFFSKKNRLYEAIVIGFMGMIAFLNTTAADYAHVYLPIYNKKITSVEPGWLWLCDVGHLLHLSYNGFSGLIVAFSTLLIVISARKMSPLPDFFLALFLIYPGMLSIIQIRQFVASAIILVAVSLLVSNSKYRNLIFLVLLLTAYLIHQSSIIAISILLVPLILRTRKQVRAIVCILLGTITIGLSMSATLFADSLFGFRAAIYLSASDGTTNVGTLGAIRNIVLIILPIVLIWLCRRYFNSIGNINNLNIIKFNRISSINYYFALFMLLLVPFVIITNDFMRFERYAFLCSLVTFSAMPALSKKEPILSSKMPYVLFALMYAISYIANSFDTVYVPLLTVSTVPHFLS